MHYMILFAEPVEIMAERDDPATSEAYWGGWMAYVSALNASGHVVSGNGLKMPAEAVTLRLRGGERIVEDGPFIDTKEQIGGYFILDVPDLETALEWAARSPAAASGSVEVRPCLPPSAA